MSLPLVRVQGQERSCSLSRARKLRSWVEGRDSPSWGPGAKSPGLGSKGQERPLVQGAGEGIFPCSWGFHRGARRPALVWGCNGVE
jgi:hypothetical protein